MLQRSQSRTVCPKLKLLVKLTTLTAVLWTSSTNAQRLETEIGDLTLRLAGRFHYDILLDSDVDKVNQVEEDWRRARLSFLARWKKDWRLAISADFPDGDPDIRNFRFDYRGWPVYLSFGRMQEPFGLSATTSSNYLPFMERPLATAIGPDYGIGIKANFRGKRWQTTVAVFGPETTGIEFEQEDDDAGEILALRTSWKVIHNRRFLLHLGVNANRFEPDNDKGLRFIKRPETILVNGLNISHPRLFNVDTNDSYGVEFALRNNSRLFQAEYLATTVKRMNNSDLQFDGYYVQGSWTLTGERRSYSTRYGVFGGIRPKNSITEGGTGAWEIAMRYSYLNLRDEVMPGVFAGEIGRVSSAGVNWYPTYNTRLMLNALYIEEEDDTQTDTGSVVQARVQFRF